jgi:hypothetical protein
MVVSAEDSADLNRNPLTFHWVVLRGDAERITIKPLNEAASRVEIQMPYHERYTVKEPTPIETNRVDIGVFVHNGTYYSAPGFVTWFFLDHEARTYDADGRLLEIGYGVGDAELTVTDWNALFALLREKEGLPCRLLRQRFRAEELETITQVAAEYRAATKQVTALQERSKHAAAARQLALSALKSAEEQRSAAQRLHDDKPTESTATALKQAIEQRAAAEEDRKRAEAIALEAQRAVEGAQRAATDLLIQKRPGLSLPVREMIEGALAAIRDQPGFYLEQREAIEELARLADAPRRAQVTAARQRLIGLGILHQEEGGRLTLRSIRAGDGPVAGRLTRFERTMLQRLHAEVLAAVIYPRMVSHTYKVNLVDQRISTPKFWRDIFQYDGKGTRTGWIRRDAEGAKEFTADGGLVVEKDALGRPSKARVVRYEFDPPLDKPSSNRTLKPVLGDGLIEYEYENDVDRTGRVKKQRSTGEGS